MTRAQARGFGVWGRTAACPMGGSISAMSFISGNSMPGRNVRGARRCKFLRPRVQSQDKRRSLPKNTCRKIAKTISSPTWAFVFRRCAWKGPGSGEPAGWAVRFGSSLVWRTSGVSDCHRDGRERAGITSCKRSRFIV